MQLIERREGTYRRTKAIHLIPLGQATVERVEGMARQVRERTLATISDQGVEKVFGIPGRICDAFSPANREEAA